MLSDLFLSDNSFLSRNSYSKLKKRAEDFLLTPIKVMSLLIAVSGLFAMMFEVRYFVEFSLPVYITRLLATLIAFAVLVSSNSEFGRNRPVILVHTLLITIIVSSGYMIYLIPSTLITNSQIVGLMIFTSALFLSWEVKNQIIVAIYYNLVFSFAILINDQSIYFLPNMYESVIFVLFLSILSVIGSAVNFKLRLQAAKNAAQVIESEKRFRSIFDNSVDGIFQSTFDGKFIITNAAMTKMLGYDDPSELLDLDIASQVFKNQDDREKLLKILEMDGYVKDYQVTLKKRNGEDIIVRLNDAICLDEENNTTYLEGSARDITQQVIVEEKKKVAEKQLREEKQRADLLADEAMQLSLAKSQFMSYLGHEIRTPVNGILGYLSLLDSHSNLGEEEAKEFMRNAKMSAESLLDLLNSILDLTKIESGRMELYEVDFNLIDLIDQAISINLSKIREKGIYISKEVDTKIPHILRGDATRIKQIFVNLINNAVKFTEKGKIEIYCRLESIEENSIVIMSSVRDTGIGIPKDKLGSLFKAFTQLDPSHSSKYGGSGLGLMICKEFVNMMGGTISVDSALNQGTTFYFTLSVKKKIEIPIRENIMKSEGRFSLKDYEIETKTPFDGDLIKKRKQYSILVAEDNVVNQKVILRMLSELGFQAEAVTDGNEAIEAVRNKKWDLVLMDVQMPIIDGLEATRQIREIRDSASKIPIVALTAHALKEDKEKCLKAGMNDYLSKPINLKQLSKILDSWLNIEAGLKEKKQPEVQPQKNVFDLQRFTEMSLGDISFQRELLMDFFEDLDQRLSKLNNFVKEKELEGLIKEVHTIKGSSYSLGAVRIGEEALGIELSGKSEDWDSILERMQTLKSTITETKETIKHLL